VRNKKEKYTEGINKRCMSQTKKCFKKGKRRSQSKGSFRVSRLGKKRPKLSNADQF